MEGNAHEKLALFFFPVVVAIAMVMVQLPLDKSPPTTKARESLFQKAFNEKYVVVGVISITHPREPVICSRQVRHHHHNSFEFFMS